MRRLGTVAVVVLSIILGSQSAFAQARPLAILMPGAGGASPIDFMVRNEDRIRAAGIETVVTTSPAQAVSLTKAAQAKGQKVVIAGMSRGARDIAQALASGARPSGVIFVSGVLGAVMSSLGSPAALPPTLVIHHRRDECDRTSPASAQRFVGWSGGKASLRWIDNTGAPVPNPCGPRGAHGFFLQDGPAVSAMIGFIRAR
ncbi:MAG: hypothetical protein Q8M26_15585 [Pseudolabrys sp.]|nr:hypothetical protein [Pseudolabrys sp.]